MKNYSKLLPLFLLITLVSCSETSLTTSSNEVISSSDTIINSEESSISSNDELDSLFDNNIIGKWYIHSTSNSTTISINDILEISKDKVLTYTSSTTNKSLTCNFTGLYENFKGACLFTSESGISKFIISIDTNNMNETMIDWGFIDTSNNIDMGTAYSYEWSNELKYQKEGSEWLMDDINAFIDVDKSNSIPTYTASYYYYHFGVSQLYDDKYVMIDIFNLTKSCRDDYYNQLVNEGYTLSKDSTGTFYTGYDTNKVYAIRLGLYNLKDENKGYNLNIFIYKYSTVYKD